MAKSDMLLRVQADTKNYDANLAKARKQLEGFKKDNLSLGGVMKQMSSSIVATAAKFASFGAAVAGAMKLAKDAFMSSERNIDEWGRTVKGAEGAYDMFLQTLNGGSWSNFFQNLSEAIRGSRDLYDALDRLGSIKNNNQAATAILENKLAQLRLLQQAGENVSDQINSVSSSLSALRGQGVEAGKNAGNMGVSTILRNAINGAGGRDIGNTTIDAVVHDIMYNGQRAIDKYANTYKVLRKKMQTRIEKIDEEGEKYNAGVYYDINKLTPAQRRQYLVANAVTTRESALAPYIGTYAQAVMEDTGGLRQEYKYNRYALQGAQGGAGGRVGGGNAAITYAVDSIAAQEKLVQDLTKAWKEASAEMRDGYLKQLNDAKNKLEDMKNPMGKLPEPTKKMLESLNLNLLAGTSFADLKEGKINVPTEDIARMSAAARISYKAGLARVGDTENPFMHYTDKGVAYAKVNEIAEGVASGMSGVVSGMEQLGIDIPEGFKSVISAVQGISTILSAINTTLLVIRALDAADTFIPFARGGIVHAAGGYVVPGNYNSADLIPAALSSGEVVLNRAQQGILSSALQNGGLQNLHLEASLSGETINLAVKAGNVRRGRGEYVTTKTRKYGYNLDA